MHKILITLSFISVLSLSACKDEQVNNQDVPKNKNEYKTNAGSTLKYSVITLQDGRKIECLEKDDFSSRYGLNCNWKPLNKNSNSNHQ